METADELVDVVDEDDRVVATATRHEVRRRQLLHRCTYVLVRNASGEILVHRRTDTKDIFPLRRQTKVGFAKCARGNEFSGG